MKFEKIDEESEIKPIKKNLGEAIDIKKIVNDVFKKKNKSDEDRLKTFLKDTNIDYKKIANNPQIKAQFAKIFSMMDALDKDERKELLDKNSALQKQLEVAQAVKGAKEELAMKIAKNAGITDKKEIEKIALGLSNIDDTINDLG